MIPLPRPNMGATGGHDGREIGLPAISGRDTDGEAGDVSHAQFVLAIVLAVYVGFSRLHHLRFLSREPMLTGILKVLRLPPQCTFWRFLASLHLGVARQLLEVQRRMRERVWEAAHVELTVVTLDTALH